MVNIRHALIAFALLLPGILLSAQTVWAAVSAEVDRSVIAEQETLRLTLSASDDDRSAEPDLSVLEKDFQIVGRSTSNQISILNGNMQSHTQWVIDLSPLRSGEITIPAIPVGRQATQPINIKVLKAQQLKVAPGNAQLFLETEAQPDQPFLQGLVRYTVRLYHAVPIKDATLSEPTVEHATLERLGKDHRYTTLRNGKRYQVVERRYALFPQQSGTLTIPSPIFRGSISEPGQKRLDPFFGRDPFAGMFGRSRPVQLKGETVTLEVKPRPENATGSEWLPAEELTLSDNWSADVSQLTAGEPVTRTITLSAKGLSASQLPELSPPSPPSIKRYPDKPALENRPAGDTLIGIREDKLALVPTKAGTFILPEFTLRWWDTRQNQERTARLPARRIVVAAATGKSAAAGDGPTPAPTDAATAPGAAAAAAPHSPATAQQGPWRWFSAGLLVLWLLTLAAWWLEHARRHRHAPAQTGDNPQAESLRALRTQLKQACQIDHPNEAHQALIKLAERLYQPAPTNLLALLPHIRDQAASRAIQELDRRLYAGASSPWNGKRFWQTVAPALEQRAPSPPSTSPVLPDLYPPAHG
jgi:hypothetical protein